MSLPALGEELRVRGLDGQADLVIDAQEPPIQRLLRQAKRTWGSKRPFGKKIADVFALINRRMPLSLPTAQRYDQAAQQPMLRLSDAVAQQLGSCRERAFLLQLVLEHLGLPARVVYGR